MNRRAFLRVTAGVPMAAAWSLSGLGRTALAQSNPATPGAAAPPAAAAPSTPPPAAAPVKEFAPRPGAWRTFEITTRVEVAKPSGVTRLWLPLPAIHAEFQEPLDNHFTGNAKRMVEMGEGDEARLLYAEFAPDETAAVLELTSRARTRDRAVDWSAGGARGGDPASESRASLQRWTAPSALIPTDGIVRDTARDITRGKASDVDKVRAVYDWVLATMYRDPKVRGCGVGDIKAILETKSFGGKCADINAMFVGLVRAAGVPARDLYGIRVAPSAFGYRTLGAGSATITKSQHCRAEVHLEERGWVAMDPADVAKVAREETGDRIPLDHPLVAPVRRELFGGWEGNWIAFNSAHDVALPNATRRDALGFLMYPQGETGDGRLDCLDPDNFKYAITTRDVTA